MSTTQSEEGGARVRVPPPAVFLGLTVVGVVIHFAIHRQPVPVGFAARLIAGSVVLCAGVALLVTALFLFRRTGQDPAPWKPSPSLIAEGPYRYSRNPIYVSMTLVQIGLGLLLDDAWVLALAPLSLAIVHFVVVVREEAYLTERFGDAYRRYQSSVRRYL